MSYEFPSIEDRAQSPELNRACQFIEKLLVTVSELEKGKNEITYVSTQHTKCAGCLKDKHTPLRIDSLGGYVCLTCIDKALTRKLTTPVFPKSWNITKWDEDGYMLFWSNGRGQTYLNKKNLDQPIEALIFADFINDLMKLNQEVLENNAEWDEAGEFPPVGATVMAHGSPGYNDLGVVTIKAYGSTLCIAENEEGEEIAFEYNDNTFSVIPEDR